MAVRERMQADLRAATKARARERMTTLRTLLAAIDNAEAVPLDEFQQLGIDQPTEAPRKYLSEEDIRQLLQREAQARQVVSAEYERLGKEAEAARLRDEVALIAGYLDAGMD